MKKLVILALAVAMTMCFASCNNKTVSNSTPTEAVKSYYDFIQKGDFKSALNKCSYDYNKEMSKEDKEMMDGMLELSANKIQEAMNQKGGLKSYEVSNEKIDGTNATVDVVLTYGNGETENVTEYLINDKGWWISSGSSSDESLDDLFSEDFEAEGEEEVAGEETAEM